MRERTFMWRRHENSRRGAALARVAGALPTWWRWTVLLAAATERQRIDELLQLEHEAMS